MAKKDKFLSQHLRDLEALQRKVSGLYVGAIEAISAKCGTVRLKGDKAFAFADFPTIDKAVSALLRSFGESLEVAIVNGVRSAWTLANNKDNEIGRAVLGKRLDDVDERLLGRYFNNRDTALEAFLKRKTGGLGLSDKVWKYTSDFRTEIELGLDIGILEGKSAAAMARDLKQYLQYPDKLFRRVRDERGLLHLSKNAAAFNPGRGVYRSSYKNALRLAVTETNMAYHAADYERWQDMDFIVGVEIRLSGNHTVLGADGKYRQLHDICDELQGRYPKDFKFTGWHPNCRCQAIPIFKTCEELDRDLERELAGEEPTDAEDSENAVRDLPENFTDWVEENSKRIETSAKKGTLPYFLRDNPEYKQYMKPTVVLDNASDGVPQYFAEYKKFRSGGRILLMDGVDKNKSDYKDLLTIAREFAKLGSEVKVTTGAHYKSDEYKSVFGSLIGTKYVRKCPDLEVDGKFYEYESYIKPWKKEKFGRMLSHGAKQSSNIIINNNKGCSRRYITSQVFNRLRATNFHYPINEVWIYEKGKIYNLYKKQKAT